MLAKISDETCFEGVKRIDKIDKQDKMANFILGVESQFVGLSLILKSFSN